MNTIDNSNGLGHQSYDGSSFASQSDKELFDQIYQKHPELDSNKDGKIDASELSDGLDQGKISLTELLSMISQGAEPGDGQGGGQQPTHTAPPDSGSSQAPGTPIDENGDGKIDASEFMKAFDKNQDGKLNTQELSEGLQSLGLGGAKPQ